MLMRRGADVAGHHGVMQEPTDMHSGGGSRRHKRSLHCNRCTSALAARGHRQAQAQAARGAPLISVPLSPDCSTSLLTSVVLPQPGAPVRNRCRFIGPGAPCKRSYRCTSCCWCRCVCAAPLRSCWDRHWEGAPRTGCGAGLTVFMLGGKKRAAESAADGGRRLARTAN